MEDYDFSKTEDSQRNPSLRESFSFSKIDNLSDAEVEEIKELFRAKVWKAVLGNDKLKRQNAQFKRAILKVAKPLMESAFIFGYAYGKRIESKK